LHGNASVIHRTQPLAVGVIRPSVRLEVGCVHGLGCWLGAGGQDSEAKIEEIWKPNHNLILSSRNIFLRVLVRRMIVNARLAS
jgi:hypothetical protein